LDTSAVRSPTFHVAAYSRNANGLAEVVPLRVREVRRGHVQRQEVHRVLEAGVAALGLEPLAHVRL